MELAFQTLNGYKVETHSRSVRFVSLFPSIVHSYSLTLTCLLLSLLDRMGVVIRRDLQNVLVK